METAISKIQAVYADLKHSERFTSRFYDVPHEFNIGMQQDAFQWLEKWLGYPALLPLPKQYLPTGRHHLHKVLRELYRTHDLSILKRC
jgi:hypothetical protein